MLKVQYKYQIPQQLKDKQQLNIKDNNWLLKSKTQHLCYLLIQVIHKLVFIKIHH